MASTSGNRSGSGKDHWSSKAYQTSASFVPQLTQTVVSYLDVQPTDQILDIGCGDGALTVELADAASNGMVLGLDSSASMIATAHEKYSAGNLEYGILDCTRLLQANREGFHMQGQFNKVFSNAALHWILRNEDIRVSVLSDIYECLRPGGLLVFEMGGHGNVAEVVGGLVSGLIAHGVPSAEARKASPWYFPSIDWMRKTLEGVGFRVEKIETEYRPTRLTEDEDGGLAGWLRLMGAQMLEKIEEGRREEVVKWVCEALEGVVRREDGSAWIGYNRLRVVARKG